MTVPIDVQYGTNIWVAAGEGNLNRVKVKYITPGLSGTYRLPKELIEHELLSPNAPDLYTYTPMHAAASYGHLHVLEYLVSKGGDVNVRDEDDETPLFTVESREVARWLVEHGATINSLNKEGNTPAEHLAEEFPSISAYLRSLDPSSIGLPSVVPPQLSKYATDQTASQMTQSLLTQAQTMQYAETEGRDQEAELREMVGSVVLNGMITGVGLAREGGMVDEKNLQGRRPDHISEAHDFKQ